MIQSSSASDTSTLSSGFWLYKFARNYLNNCGFLGKFSLFSFSGQFMTFLAFYARKKKNGLYKIALGKCLDLSVYLCVQFLLPIT